MQVLPQVVADAKPAALLRAGEVPEVLELATLSEGGRILGNLTAAQALLRKLSDSESRAALAKKALKALKRKRHLDADAVLKQMLEQAAPSAGALAASPRQPATG